MSSVVNQAQDEAARVIRCFIVAEPSVFAIERAGAFFNGLVSIFVLMTELLLL